MGTNDNNSWGQKTKSIIIISPQKTFFVCIDHRKKLSSKHPPDDVLTLILCNARMMDL